MTSPQEPNSSSASTQAQVRTAQPRRAAAAGQTQVTALQSVRDLQILADGAEGNVVSLVIVNAVATAAKALGISGGFPELAGIDLCQLEDPAVGISRTVFWRMLERLFNEADEESVGLLLGSALRAHHFHFAGPLVMSMVSGRRAIDCFLELRRSVLGGAAWSYSTTREDEVRIGHRLGKGVGGRVEAELGMTVGYLLALEFWGSWVRELIQVEFAFAEPRDRSRYHAIFGDHVRFRAEQNCLVFPPLLLDQARPGADSYLAIALSEFARKRYLLANSGSPWSRATRLALMSAPSLQDLSMESVSATWKISGRTLRRRLERESTSFRQIWDAVRFERAAYLLGRGDRSVQDIAEEVGFAEVNAFRRAFGKWSGRSPSRFRSGTRAAQSSQQVLDSGAHPQASPAPATRVSAAT